MENSTPTADQVEQLDLFPEPAAEHHALVWRRGEGGALYLDGTPCICPLCNPPAKKRRK